MTELDPNVIKARVALLSDREREIIRQMTGLTTAADVAAELGIRHETVRTHIKNARRKLGGVSGFTAAKMLAVAEGRNPNSVNPVVRVIPKRVVEPVVEAPREGRTWRDLLPIRQQGAIGNDLSIAARLLWIVVLAIGLAVGFGMASVGVTVISNLIARM